MNDNTGRLLVTLGLGLGFALALVWLLGSSLPGVRAAPGDVYCVTPGGGTYPDCTDVFTNVQAAVDAASGGEEIRVAAGTYTGVGGRTASPGYLGPALITQVVYVSTTVTIQGGYTTTNWTTPDSEANPTTLDAQGQGRVLYIASSVSPTLEGLRVTGGEATGLRGVYLIGRDAGGGVYVYTATATISNCVITSNTASTAADGFGGGLYIQNSSATLSGNTVFSNTASTTGNGFGGGLFLHGSPARLNGSVVVSNTASTGSGAWGGGLYLSYSDATLSGNTVRGNAASTGAGGTGGGLCLSDSDAILSANTIVSNTASTVSYGDAGGLSLERSDATLSGNTVVGNVASAVGNGDGGGLWLLFSDATLSGNMVRGNTAGAGSQSHGGGLYLEYSDAVLSDNTVQGNTAGAGSQGQGGGLYLEHSQATLNGNAVVSNTAALSPTATGEGGGLWVRYSGPLSLTNNLVADNQANTQGSGLWFEGSSSDPTSGSLLHTTIADNHSSGQGVYVGPHATLAFTNTIVAGHHSVGITITTGGTATLEATLWHDNGMPIGGGGTVVSSTNVTGDPAFANPAAWNYHLTAGSAAIDKGVDAGVDVDIDGDPRPTGAGYDVGADEYYNPALQVTKQATPDPVQTGEQLTYTIRVTNTGNVTLTATITDVLPDHVTTTQPLVWASQVIPAPGTWMGTVVVAVEEGYAGPLTNGVQVTTEEGAMGVDSVTVEAVWYRIYLPLVLKQ
jgi:uncharacterized repeat protein (TIGR01451 family)